MNDEEFTFKGQREGEDVIEVVNSHPYLMYRPGLKVMLMLVCGVAIMLFYPRAYLLSVGVFLFASLVLFRAIYCFKSSVTILTKERIFCIDQRGFLKRKITEMELDRIIDMTSETEGLAKAMLKYGDLIVRSASAGDSSNLVIKNISNPYELQQKIATLSKAHKHSTR